MISHSFKNLSVKRVNSNLKNIRKGKEKSYWVVIPDREIAFGQMVLKSNISESEAHPLTLKRDIIST